MVSTDNIVGLTKAIKKLAHKLEAICGSSIQLLGLGAVLGLTDVTKGDLRSTVG